MYKINIHHHPNAGAAPATHKVALPIDNMTTTLPIIKGGVTPVASVGPVNIDQMIQAERDSLSDKEKAFQEENGTNATPSSFDAAECFINKLKNPPGANVTDPEYNAVRDACIGLLTVFACRRLLGLNITAHEIDMSPQSPSILLKALGAQLGGESTLTYFCMDGEAFAYIYKGYLVPVKDKGRFCSALTSVPFFNNATGTFNDILSATAADAHDGKLLFKQLLYAFLFDVNGAQNINAQILGMGYNHVLTYINGAWNGTPYLTIVRIGAAMPATLKDVLLNAPYCGGLPDRLFSDKLLLFKGDASYTPPCFAKITYEIDDYYVVNPISEELCRAIITGSNVELVRRGSDGIYRTDWEGAPDCDGCDPDTEDAITCRIRLNVDGTVITIQKMYAVGKSCEMKNSAGLRIDRFNMGIDCNINPIPPVIGSIFRRYIVWDCPDDDTSVYFDTKPEVFPVTHLQDKAKFAIVEPTENLPKFAFIRFRNSYCGCIRFPEPVVYSNTMLNSPTAIYLDFGTTNTICLVSYYGPKDPNAYAEFVDIKKYVRMVTGDKGSAEFRIFHLLSDRDSGNIIRSIAVCAEEANNPALGQSSLYRAHALNAGKDAIDQTILAAQKVGTGKDLDLRSVNVYDSLKWTSDAFANEGYRAVAGSIFSSAIAMVLQKGFNPAFTEIHISVPSSMSDVEVDLTMNRVNEALTNIGANLQIHQTHFEATAAASFIINDPAAGVPLGANYNIGVDIGGGTIDLFSFRSQLGKKAPIPAAIDSVKDAAGKKILSETFVQAAKAFPDPRGNSSLFFQCFAVNSTPPESIVHANDTAALCITESFIPEAEFRPVAGADSVRYNTFRRNVLMKMIGVLNYAAAFAKASWPDEDLSEKTVNIILCGNGSNIWGSKWSGIDGAMITKITNFIKSRIGCARLQIVAPAQTQRKKETVTGMKHIVKFGAGAGGASFRMLNENEGGTVGDESSIQSYTTSLLEAIRDNNLLQVIGDTVATRQFYEKLIANTDSRIANAIDYVLYNDSTTDPDTGDRVFAKGEDLFYADVFLRLLLEMPFIS